MTLHPIVQDAADGHLPPWAEATEERRAHMARVADLLEEWAKELGHPGTEVARWRATGLLHDVLRDAVPAELRTRLPESLAGWPDPVLHGPAAAERLRTAGVLDGPLLHAIAYHPLGSPGFDGLGEALYTADFLDPGRPFRREWRAELRRRMPGEGRAVVREVAAARIRHAVDRGQPLLRPTVDFWNVLVGGPS